MAALTLPAADWRDRAGLAELAALLGGDGEARFVGGAVRDTLLGLPVADIDLATRLRPEAVLDRLRGAGVKAVPTGLAHGTITAVLPDGPIEVTTLRRDVETDGRHAVVAFSDDWREDAARRDFTMNALYAEPGSGVVHDYFGGRDDLAAGRVRFIGDPYQRIAEDHLRILRFFRFHARFGDAIDAAGLKACAARANDLMALSRERIATELLKLLVARHAVPVVALMAEHGLFAPVLPEIDADGPPRLARLAAREAQAGLPPEAIRRLAALLPPDPATGEAVAVRLKLSNADRKRLALALVSDGGGSPDALAYAIGARAAVDRMLLGDAAPALIARIAAWQPPTLPLTGGALIARGLPRGPEVARVLREIETQWIAEGFPGEARVFEIADAAVAQALRSRSSA